MSYDRWKLQNDHDQDLRQANGPLDEDPGEREAREAHEQNVMNLLEGAEELGAEELTFVADSTDAEHAAWRTLGMEAWLEHAEPEELEVARGRIDLQIAKKLDERVAAAKNVQQIAKRLKLPKAAKPRKSRSDKGRSNPNNVRKPRKEPQS